MTRHELQQAVAATSSYLSRQARVLTRLAEEVEALEHLLMARNGDEIRAVVSQIEELSHPMQSLRVERDELRQQIARLLNLPADRANVTALAKAVGRSEARQLKTERDKVLALAERIDYRTQVNSVMIRRTLERGEQIFQQIAAASLESDRYRADGRRAAPLHGSLFQARG